MLKCFLQASMSLKIIILKNHFQPWENIILKTSRLSLPFNPLWEGICPRRPVQKDICFLECQSIRVLRLHEIVIVSWSNESVHMLCGQKIIRGMAFLCLRYKCLTKLRAPQGWAPWTCWYPSCGLGTTYSQWSAEERKREERKRRKWRQGEEREGDFRQAQKKPSPSNKSERPWQKVTGPRWELLCPFSLQCFLFFCFFSSVGLFFVFFNTF